jgi:nicotinate-nucleotide adenylyltransferase
VPRRDGIGIFGGTFDPIHFGHLRMAEEARDQLCLDRVLFVPNRVSPFKAGGGVSPGELRAEMVRRAIADNPSFAISRVELDRPGPSYAIETVRALRDAHPDADLFFLSGTDAIKDLPAWREPEALLVLARFVAATRPGVDPGAVLAALPRILGRPGDVYRDARPGYIGHGPAGARAGGALDPLPRPAARGSVRPRARPVPPRQRHRPRRELRHVTQTSPLSSEEKAKLLLDTVEDRKAVDPVLLDLRGQTLMADFFLICSGTSNVHIRSIADAVLERADERDVNKPRVEGQQNAEWVLLDFGDVVLHVMAESRGRGTGWSSSGPRRSPRARCRRRPTRSPPPTRRRWTGKGSTAPTPASPKSKTKIWRTTTATIWTISTTKISTTRRSSTRRTRRSSRWTKKTISTSARAPAAAARDADADAPAGRRR